MPRIEGHDIEALRRQPGRFFESVTGQRPSPPFTEQIQHVLRYVDPERGELSWEFPPNPAWAGHAGLIFGGYLAAMVDSTAGACIGATAQPDEIAFTVEMKINYVAPAKVDTVISEARIVRKGRSIAFVECELRNTAGDLLVTSSATFQIRQRS
jgi:uncharacterized protein (TIGR00369 family)